MEKLKMAATARWLSLVGASMGMLLLVPGAVSAQSTLTWARVELTRNQVQLFTNGQSRRARVSDVLGVDDALSTARRARAELRFNDGSLARIGESAVFRFTPNTRNFRLSNGTVLLLIPPGQGRTTIQTPNAVTGIHGSGLFVRFVPETSTTIVGALTNNPDGPMTVFNQDGSEQVSLYAGQMAMLRGNQPIKRFRFDMPMFYSTNKIADDLDLANPEGFTGDEAIDAVRREILEALSQEGDFDQDEDDSYVVENPAFLSASLAASSSSSSSYRATVPDFDMSPAAAFLQQTIIAEGFEIRRNPSIGTGQPPQATAPAATPQPPSQPRPQPPSQPVEPIEPAPAPPTTGGPITKPLTGPTPVAPPNDQNQPPPTTTLPAPTAPEPVDPIVKPTTPVTPTAPAVAEPPAPAPAPTISQPSAPKPVNVPANIPANTPANTPANAPANTPANAPANTPVPASTVPPIESANQPIEKPARLTAEPGVPEVQVDRLPDAISIQDTTQVGTGSGTDTQTGAGDGASTSTGAAGGAGPTEQTGNP